MIKTERLSFAYSEGENVLNNISLEIEKGSFTAVLGRNGSGKSTLAKHFNALLLPSDGAVYVKGLDTREEKNLFAVRSSVGMVFQNPENQAVAAEVEDEVAFAPENLGVEPREIRRRVDEALRAVGLEERAKDFTAYLSGGQKQRLAAAAVLAMEPECIIFDESTSMLDPSGREDLLKTIRRLNREKGITVVLITHHMDEAARADRVLVTDNGEVVLDGTPREVFGQAELLDSVGLGVPQTVELACELRKSGVDFPENPLTADECFEALMRLLGGGASD